MTYYEFLWRWVKYAPEDDFYCFDCVGDDCNSDYLYCWDCLFENNDIETDCVLDKLHADGKRFRTYNNVLKLAQGLRKAGLLKQW